ncbi:cytochrome c oxidase subunit 4 mitochondrial, partial [Fusarium mundagurra]
MSTLLLKLLQSLGGRKKKKTLSKSVWVKWDSMRKAGDVKEIEGRLIEYRSEILLRMNLMLTNQKSLAALQTEATNWKAQTMVELKKTKSRLELALQGLKQQEQEINDDESSSEPDENEARARGKSRQRPAFRPLQALLDQFGNLTTSASAQHCILRQLIFDSMRSREAAIHTPETGTFEWMVTDDLSNIFNFDQEHKPSGLEYEPENSALTLDAESGGSEASLASSETMSVKNQFEHELQDLHNMSNEEHEWNVRKCQKKSQIQAKAGFNSWLSCFRGGNLFHISGKAGSGKSTLMKFLYNHKHTRARLEEWASPCKLVLAHFYFWIASGDDLQKSLQGLYRSLLFQVLSNNPDLIPLIFPLQWDQVKGAPFQSSKLVALSFPPTAFQEAFRRLLIVVQESHRICLFIDGMDEYDDKDLTFWKLAQLVQVWTSYPYVKICSSARPYLAFTETFGKGRQLMHLHHTTMYDIYVFSLATFKKDPNKAYIRKVYPHLARSIVARAEGVFLWAWLVVRILVEGAGQQDSLQILVKKLFSLPKDTSKLYGTLLERVTNLEDKKRLSMMLRLNLLIPGPDLVYYGWLDDWDNPEFPPNIDLSGALEETKLEDHCQRAWKQVTGISNGLLQIVENPRYKQGRPGLMDAFSMAPRTGTPPWTIISPWAVTFAHHTVRDFLIENPKLISDQHANSEPDMLQIWYRLLLCDYAHMTSLQLASLGCPELTNRHNDRIKEILGHQKVLISAPILDKFDFHSRLISARAIPFIGRLESEARWDTAVLNYAARCGYHDFIISKLKTEPNRLSGAQAVSNLLVCMALGYE